MRRLLLDTHTLLCWLSNDNRLGPNARALIADERNEAYVSAASAWELSIKKAIGKLVAQSQAEGLELVTADERIVAYSIRTVSALQ